jgi:hypothetical protein
VNAKAALQASAAESAQLLEGAQKALAAAEEVVGEIKTLLGERDAIARLA